MRLDLIEDAARRGALAAPASRIARRDRAHCGPGRRFPHQALRAAQPIHHTLRHRCLGFGGTPPTGRSQGGGRTPAGRLLRAARRGGRDRLPRAQRRAFAAAHAVTRARQAQPGRAARRRRHTARRPASVRRPPWPTRFVAAAARRSSCFSPTDAPTSRATAPRGARRADEDARQAARGLRSARVATLVVDTSARSEPAARRLAEDLGATYLALPYAAAQTLSRAVRALPNPGHA